jgi:hypothetical protein
MWWWESRRGRGCRRSSVRGRTPIMRYRFLAALGMTVVAPDPNDEIATVVESAERTLSPSQ